MLANLVDKISTLNLLQIRQYSTSCSQQCPGLEQPLEFIASSPARTHQAVLMMMVEFSQSSGALHRTGGLPTRPLSIMTASSMYAQRCA